MHEVRSFLGLCSYYRRFIQHFAALAAPLHDLTKKNSVFKWGESQRSAFPTLKEKLTTEPILVVHDLCKSFEVHGDACGDCIGTALHQEGHVVAYEIQRLQNVEKQMGIYERELLAVIHALTTWKQYLLGADFTVRTDHQSLSYSN